MKLFSILFAGLIAMFGSRAMAHHSFAAEFDAHSPVVLKGKVTKVELINPHAWVYLDVETPGKPKQAWMVEGGSPNKLLRAGINRDTLKVGSEIVVHGFQSKDHACKPACKANGRDLTFPDGHHVFMGSSGHGAPLDGADPDEPMPSPTPTEKK